MICINRQQSGKFYHQYQQNSQKRFQIWIEKCNITGSLASLDWKISYEKCHMLHTYIIVCRRAFCSSCWCCLWWHIRPPPLSKHHRSSMIALKAIKYALVLHTTCHNKSGFRCIQKMVWDRHMDICMYTIEVVPIWCRAEGLLPDQSWDVDPWFVI